MHRIEGYLLVLAGQYDSSPVLDPIATRAKQLEEKSIFIGTPSDRKIIPISLPNKSLTEICDVSVGLFGGSA